MPCALVSEPPVPLARVSASSRLPIRSHIGILYDSQGPSTLDLISISLEHRTVEYILGLFSRGCILSSNHPRIALRFADDSTFDAMVSVRLDEYVAKEAPGYTCDSIAQAPYLKPLEFDGTYPLTDYFISTSHNTYLIGNQLWGGSSPEAYTRALTGHPPTIPPVRCVEIDAWYTSSGPIVTHGHTFTQSIPFQAVCAAIGDAVKPDSLPITVSLECHVGVDKQAELAEIMKATWGDKLVIRPVHESVGDETHGLLDHHKARVSPDDLRGKIFMMIEYYLDKDSPVAKKESDQGSSSPPSDSDFSDSEQAQEMKASQGAHKAEGKKIHPQLAALGIYAQSIKPAGNWLVQELLEPLHALINISESGLSKLLPHSLDGLIGHACKHMRRCYPRGTRVESSNMDPLPMWRAGTQVTALNMQVWDMGTQLNAALFEGSQGWVLKPESLRGGYKRSGEVTFKVEVIGADDVPNPTDKKNPATYFVAELFTPAGNKSYKSKVVEDHSGDPMWNETVEWKSEDAELVFFQLRVYQDRWGKDVLVAVFTVHVDRLEQGLRFWPLIGGEGNVTQGKVLVRVH